MMNGTVNPRFRAMLLLFIATLSWAASFPAYKHLLVKLDPMALQMWRFLLAAGLIITFRYREVMKTFRRDVMIPGLFLGVVLWVGYTVQAFGIKWTSASHAAFLTALLILFGPLFYRIMSGRRFRPIYFGLWFLALVGIGLLTIRNWHWSWGWGDTLCVVGAIAFGLEMVMVDRWARANNVRPLTFTLLFVIALFTAIICLISGQSLHQIRTLNGVDWVALMGLALFPSWLAFEWQLDAQPYLQTPAATLIYAMEPLLATLIAYWWVDESLQWVQWIGALCVVLALLGSQRFPIFADAPVEIHTFGSIDVFSMQGSTDSETAGLLEDSHR